MGALVSGENAPFVDLRQVRRNYAAAAEHYNEVAVLQREINSRMLERLDYVKIEPRHVLDLGCGAGISLAALSERYPKAQIIGADISEPMLLAAQGQRSRLRRLLPFLHAKRANLLAADACALPLASDTQGLVWSNLLMHWLDDPLPAFREAQRTLAVGGLLMFSTFGPDTLKELRACFSDGHAHTQRFADMHDYGDMLLECGFSDPVMDVDTLTMTYASFDDVLRDLRQNGATCAMQARRRGLMGKGEWQAARLAYEALRVEGRLPATFEIVYGHAWKLKGRAADAAHADKTSDGRTVVRFDPKARLR